MVGQPLNWWNSLSVRMATLVVASILLVGLLATGASVMVLTDVIEQARSGWYASAMRLEARRASELLESASQSVELLSGHLAAKHPPEWLLSPVSGSHPPAPPQQVVNELVDLCEHSPFYHQVRILDTQGWERVRINRRDSGWTVVAPKDLQDKSKRNYFSEMANGGADEVYFSQLDLNVENGEIEVPHVAVSRIGAVIEARDGQRAGYLLINLDIGGALLSAQEEAYPEIGVALVDDEGAVLASNVNENIRTGAIESAVRELAAQPANPDNPNIRFGVYSVGGRDYFSALGTFAVPATAAPQEVGLLFLFDHETMYADLVPASYLMLALILPVLLAAVLVCLAVVNRFLAPQRALAAALLEHGTSVAADRLPRPRDNDGQILYDALVLVLKDLRESEERLSIAIEGSNEGLWNWPDIEKEEVWCSPMFFELLGYDNEEIPSTRAQFLKLLHPDDRERMTEAVERQVVDNVRFDLEYRLRTRSGTYRWYQGKARLFKNPDTGANGLAGSIQDIHRRKMAEFAMVEQERDLLETIDDLNRFTYIASHDLKAPLRAIDNLSAWVQKDCADILPEKQSKYLEKMRSRVDRMEALLDDLLNYSRAGRESSEIETFNVGKMIRELVEFVALPDKFDVVIEEPMPDVTLAATAFRHVMQNLISNTVKHHDKESGKIVITAEIRNQRLEMSFSDDGPGIPPDMRDRVFELFQTVQSRDKVEGSGVGLAIVKKLVSSNHGKIWIATDDGQGVTFRLSWPLGGKSGDYVE